MARPDWLLFQLADSAFPVGGFAHSGGLEAAQQSGLITPEKLAEFLNELLWQVGFGALPFVRAAISSPLRLAEIDQKNSAFLVNHVAHRASRVQGRALLDTSARIFLEPEMAALRERVKREGMAPHHAPLFGAIYRVLGVGEGECLGVYLHLALRQGVSAAVRLGIVGPHEGQRLQRGAQATLDRVLDECALLDEDDVAQTAPLVDLVQSTHDRLYSRLFQS